MQNLSCVNMFHYDAKKKTHFHKKGFALGLVLRVRVFGTRKWPIRLISTDEVRNINEKFLLFVISYISNRVYEI